MLTFVTLGISVAGVLLFGSQAGARVLDSSTRIPASNIQGAALLPSAPDVVCSNGDYAITQSTGASIVAGTTDVGNHTDDGTTNIALPFTFRLYGVPFNTVNVGSNGNLQFNSTVSTYSNTCLPNIHDNFGYAIFAHW